MMQWKKQPPGEHAGSLSHHNMPQSDCCVQSGDSLDLVPLVLHSKVFIWGNKLPSTI